MLLTFITIVALIILWVISLQRKLVVLDENICNAMSQIGVQLSSRFDALMALLNLTKDYAKHEGETLIDIIYARRAVITGKSTPNDVLYQEGVITEALGKIALLTKQYPEVRSNPMYVRSLDAMQTFDNMLRTSRLIYNDCVMKLNREIRMFPVTMIAGMLGFQQKEYL